MSWVNDMERDAVAILDPDFELLEGDDVRLEFEYNKGYAYSSYTFEDTSFNLEINVYRNGVQMLSYRYEADEIQGFMAALMSKGSERYEG